MCNTNFTKNSCAFKFYFILYEIISRAFCLVEQFSTESLMNSNIWYILMP